MVVAMLTAIIVLAVFGTVVLTWSNMRAAAETATHYGRRACEEAGVQWLDHTVMLEGLRPRRAPDGWVRLLRRYRFDFSTDGRDRHRGHLELLGDRLQWLRMPPLPVAEPAAMMPAASSDWQMQIRLPAAPSREGGTPT